MSEPYVGEIRIVGFNFAPNGWALCNGQLLSISDNDVLFNLIGTTYGGDGITTFALPDLQGRLPVHQGNSHVIGEHAGSEYVTLTNDELPSHAHHVQGTSAAATSKAPAGNFLAASARSIYGGGSLVSMHSASIGTTGSGQPHNNMQPFLCASFVISLFGVYPSQT